MKSFKYIAILVFAFAASFLLGIRVVRSADHAGPDNLPSVYYVHSDNSALKALLGASHDFNGVFSTELSGTELALLNRLGVKTEPVSLRRISAPPGGKCGDGVCQGFENANSCSQDCGSSGEDPTPTPTPEETSRSCTPGTKTPWGIVKVNGGSGGAGVKVAVLDTGVYQEHLDLVNRVEACVTQVTHHNADAKDCDDAHGHGTHTSGTVLADSGSDGQGIMGVAPEARLLAVKVCDRRGWCFGDDVAAGIRWAADNGANIVSMSLGGDSPDSQEEAAIDHALSQGVLVVAAAGNDGPSEGSIDYPGAFYQVVAAGAIDSGDKVPDWSSRGVNDGDYEVEEREVEFGTPGVSVLSTTKDGCYGTASGTSMATPHVSGLAAKLWQGSAETTRSYLQDLAKNYDLSISGDDPATGFGLPIAP